MPPPDPGTSIQPHRVGFVRRASAKLRKPAPARELYGSQLFKKAFAYAKQTCDRWYVLSAKHAAVLRLFRSGVPRWPSRENQSTMLAVRMSLMA